MPRLKARGMEIIMKRMIYIMTIATVVLHLIACQSSSQQDIYDPVLGESEEILIATAEPKTDLDIAFELYNEFLTGNTRAGSWDINEMTTPTGEPDKHYATSYAYFDSNGDKIPELHVKTGKHYNIFTIRDNKIVEWKILSPNPPYYALNNGALLCRRFGAGPKEDTYKYIILDYLGNEIYRLSFSKYDQNKNEIYDDDDEYLFDEINVTKGQWEALTEKFLYIDEAGIEQIKNEIEWIVLFEGTN